MFLEGVLYLVYIDGLIIYWLISVIYAWKFAGIAFAFLLHLSEVTKNICTNWNSIRLVTFDFKTIGLLEQLINYQNLQKINRTLTKNWHRSVRVQHPNECIALSIKPKSIEKYNQIQWEPQHAHPLPIKGRGTSMHVNNGLSLTCYFSVYPQSSPLSLSLSVCQSGSLSLDSGVHSFPDILDTDIGLSPWLA